MARAARRLGWATLAVGIISCWGDQAGAQTAADPKVVDPILFEAPGVPGGTLTLSVLSSPRSFNYYGVIDNVAYEIMGQVLSPLVEENPVTFELEPGLASSWEVFEDGRTVPPPPPARPLVRWNALHRGDDVVFTMVHVVMNPNAEGNPWTALPWAASRCPGKKWMTARSRPSCLRPTAPSPGAFPCPDGTQTQTGTRSPP